MDKTKYEIVEIGQAEITVDVSLLLKSEDLFFNATEMAKIFDKDVREFLKSEPVNRYIDAILNEWETINKNYNDLIQTKKGRYGGTWLHNDLFIEFVSWCSASFRVTLHKHAKKVLCEEMLNSIKQDPIMPGHVYAIQKKELVKIGISKIPKRRIGNIETHYASKLENQYISPLLKDYKQIEEKAHSYFKERRKFGEWFSVNFNEVVEYLQKVMSEPRIETT